MPLQEFEFDLKVDAGAGASALADAVIAEILRHVGIAGDAGLIAEIRVAVGDACDSGRPCAVCCRARGGELEIVVSAGPRATCRIVHPIPQSGRAI